jgi:D-glycero-D-manno-heptose 1,7-bisphosphate phosphatase
MTSGKPAVLTDRDGTIIEDVPYLSRLSDVRLLPGVSESIRRLNRLGIPVAVVTNQSGVARGLFSESFVRETHSYIGNLLAKEGAHIEAFFYCPHLPEAAILEYRAACQCRKPEPGLLLEAMERLGASAPLSAMVGDMLRDMIAAQKSGVRGYLIHSEDGGNPDDPGVEYVRVASFSEAVDRYLESFTNNR